MNGRTNGIAPNANRRETPPPSPDLFGFVAPASVTATSSTPPGRAGEWPAAAPAATRLPLATAPDRPPEREPARGLAGEYERRGMNLRRPDGRALVVCLSVRPGRPPRYVQTVAPGSALRYCGSLFSDTATGVCDLDGTEFQDGTDRTRYRISRTGPDRYAVAPVRRRGRSGR